jgi:hypothetical protein
VRRQTATAVAAGLRFGILAPEFGLPVFFEAGGIPQGIEIGTVLDRGETHDQRRGKTGQVDERCQREGIERFEMGAQGLQRFGRVGKSPRRRAKNERRTALHWSQRSVPRRWSAAPQRFVGFRAIAQGIGVGIRQETCNRLGRVGRDDVEGMVGHVAKGKASRVDLFALIGPFGDQCVPSAEVGRACGRPPLGLDRAPVEQDAKTMFVPARLASR